MKKYTLLVGIDVAKKKLDVCFIGDPQSKKHEYLIVSNDVKGLKQILKVVDRLGHSIEQVLFCFENTGIYSMPAACFFSAQKADYWVVPAIEIKRSRGLTRGKSDKIDARDIAYYAHTHQYKLQLSQLPEEDILKLKLLQTERDKLLKASLILKTSQENDGFLPKAVSKEISKVNRQATRALEKSIAQVERRMVAIIRQNPILNKQFKLITSVPGVGPQTAIYLMVATKCFKTFGNWRKLACYAGVVPFEYSSGSSIRGRTKLNHLADKKLKSLLNLCALSAKRIDKELSDYFSRKTHEGKHPMLVMNALRCKILSRVFAVINRETPFVNTRKFAA